MFFKVISYVGVFIILTGIFLLGSIAGANVGVTECNTYFDEHAFAPSQDITINVLGSNYTITKRIDYNEIK